MPNDLISEYEGGVKVRMLVTRKGALGNCGVRTYYQGKAYEIAPSLASGFFRDGSVYRLDDDYGVEVSEPQEDAKPAVELLYEALKPLPNKEWGNFRPSMHRLRKEEAL